MEESFLKSVALFAEFEPDELMALSRGLQTAQFAPGDPRLAPRRFRRSDAL
jgi:hypothetical protein